MNESKSNLWKKKLKAFFEKYFGLFNPTDTITESKVVDYQDTMNQAPLGTLADEPASHEEKETQ